MHGPRVSIDAARLYQQAINDVASMLVLASQNSFEVMCAIEDGTVEAPEEIFFGFGECQDRLNKLIQNRATLKASVDTGAEVAERLAHLVRELKKYRHDERAGPSLSARRSALRTAPRTSSPCRPRSKSGGRRGGG